MAIQSNVCVCENCVGAQCACGCQNPVTAAAASCQCGEACNCGDTCTCADCEHVGARIQETR